MSRKIHVRMWWLAGVALLLFAACDRKSPQQHTDFTRADSVTETYLALQDTMLQVWNRMMHDDNRKIRAMRHLIHELSVSNPEKTEQLRAYEQRLDDLVAMRYDQESISDVEVVSEYDFASNSLVSELIALAESQREFAYNPTLQQLVDSIRSADQRVNNYRAEYDVIARRYNTFLETNQQFLEELDADSTMTKKPLFQMAAE